MIFKNLEKGQGHLGNEPEEAGGSRTGPFDRLGRAKETEKEPPVRRRNRNVLKVERRRGVGGGCDQLPDQLGQALFPPIIGVFLPASPVTAKPSAHAAPTCSLGSTLTVMSVKEAWGIFSRGWRQNGLSMSSIH